MSGSRWTGEGAALIHSLKEVREELPGTEDTESVYHDLYLLLNIT